MDVILLVEGGDEASNGGVDGDEDEDGAVYDDVNENVVDVDDFDDDVDLGWSLYS